MVDNRNEYQREYTKKNPEVRRKSHIKKYYNLDWDVYCRMFASQEGKCKICDTQISLYKDKKSKAETTAVDHCHTTGRVRGLLCSKCNKGLGLFDDNIELLKIAIDYLEESHEYHYKK